jgi:N-acetylmuramoyl-L-alanine amidase
VTIALDPGHQLGNHRFPRQTRALVPAGGFRKPCNTTGTSTASGIAEATVNFRLALAVKRRLEHLGARIRLTRTTNRQDRWGPCVDARGRFGKRVGARLMVSLHADGAPSSRHGFHVITPVRRSPWTTDISADSLRLAQRLRNSLTAYRVPRSSYVGHGTGLVARRDLGTLNMSDVPVAMIEVGNMRNRLDARRMTAASGRARYANAVVRGIRTYLRR